MDCLVVPRYSRLLTPCRTHIGAPLRSRFRIAPHLNSGCYFGLTRSPQRHGCRCPPGDLVVELCCQLGADLHHRQPDLGAGDQAGGAASTWPAPGSARRTAAASGRRRFARRRARPRVAGLELREHRGKGFGLDMRRQQDRAVGAVAERVEILRVLAGQDAEAGGPSAAAVRAICARLAPQSFMPTMLGCSASRSSVSLPRPTEAR